MLSPDQLIPGSIQPQALPRPSQDALAHWAGLRRDGRLPSWREFDPMRIPRLLANVCVVDVLRDPADFRFRLVGNILVENMVRDRTGERFTDIPQMAPGTVFWDRYVAVTDSGRVSCAQVRYAGANQLIRHCWDVLMPFADEARRVDRILVHVSYANLGDTPL